MKPIINESTFRKNLKTEATGGYLFFGEEDYLKSNALKLARKTLCADESLGVFNDISIDCSDCDFSVDRISAALMSAPMMADSKIVTVTSLCVNDLKQSEIAELCDAFSEIENYDFNMFIVSVPSGMIDEGYLPKKPSSVLAKLCEHLTPVNFERVPDAKLSSWAVRHFEHNGVMAENGVCTAIFNRCGRNMFTLANEIDKLSFFVLSRGEKVVTLQDVMNVTSENEEFDSFAFSTAILESDFDLALRILGLLKSKKTEPVIILGEISRTITDMLSVKMLNLKGIKGTQAASMLKIHPYKLSIIEKSVKEIPLEKLKAAVDRCAQADSALKLSPFGYIEIERLICSF